jgi:hypothetical protein
MKIPLNEEKYLSSWNLVETARYVNSLKKVIRDKDGDQPKFTKINELSQYANQHNNIRYIYFYLALQCCGHK